jgi:hypothetical protein
MQIDATLKNDAILRATLKNDAILRATLKNDAILLVRGHKCAVTKIHKYRII